MGLLLYLGITVQIGTDALPLPNHRCALCIVLIIWSYCFAGLLYSNCWEQPNRNCLDAETCCQIDFDMLKLLPNINRLNWFFSSVLCLFTALFEFISYFIFLSKSKLIILYSCLSFMMVWIVAMILLYAIYFFVL